MLVLNHQRLGRGSTKKNPCLRSRLKLPMDSLEECLWFPCSLDSGVFTTSIPQELLRKSRYRGVWLEENNRCRQTKLLLVALESQNLLFYSSNSASLFQSGSSITSWTPCFFILEDIPTILVGRDLLKALGIEPYQLLRTKPSEGLIPPELDVSGIFSIFSESGMKSMSLYQGQISIQF